MLKTASFMLSVAVLVCALWYPSYAADPAKMSDVAPVEALVKAADEKIDALDKHLADSAEFAKSRTKKNIKKDAGILAVLAQSIALHEQSSAWQNSAADVRDQAIKLASSKSHEEAKTGLEAVKSAKQGASNGAVKEIDWAELTDFESLMKEVTRRNSKLRRAERKMRKGGLDEKARDKAALDASVLAVLALVVDADTHSVKEPAEIAQWKQYAKDFQSSASKFSAAMKQGDAKQVKVHYTALKKSCKSCHKQFREDED